MRLQRDPIAFRAVIIAAFAASRSNTAGDFAVVDGRVGALRLAFSRVLAGVELARRDGYVRPLAVLSDNGIVE